MNIQATPLACHSGTRMAATAPGAAGAFQCAGRVVAVVTTHNRLAQLRRTLAHLLAAPVLHLAAVVVVDNASDDGTGAFLASIPDPRLHVLHMARNTGGAGGFAAGLDHARARFDPDWYLIMDDDARPLPDALARFHASDLRGWDAVAGAVYDPAGRICDINRPTYDPFASVVKFLRTLRAGREGFHLGPKDYAGGVPVPIDGASFVGLFLSRRGLALGGLPEARLFVYADDALQTLRLSRAGGRIVFLPDVRFEHDYAATAPGQSGRPLWKVYYRHRNALILYRHAAGWLFWPICALVIPVWALRMRAYPAQRRRFLAVFLRGVWHGVLRRTGTAHETVLKWADPVQ